MFLPESRYQGLFNDDEWIQEQLAKLPQQWRAGSIKKYSTIFESKGRSDANTWLRLGVKSHGVR